MRSLLMRLAEEAGEAANRCLRSRCWSHPQCLLGLARAVEELS